MSIKLQILIIVVILLAMLYIINHVRKKKHRFQICIAMAFCMFRSSDINDIS